MVQVYDIIKPMVVQMSQSGERLDRAISMLLPNYSRSQIKRWILSNKVKVNNQSIIFPKKKMMGGELIEIIDVVNDIVGYTQPQSIPLDIVYEDNDIIIINKTKNLVVHPGAGNHFGTIFNALLYRYPSIIRVTRGGIVHRLDKDTTGLMVVAKNIVAYNCLLQLFRKRQIIREYDAVVFGRFSHNIGIINQPIRRHVTRRTCMAVHCMGKPAITYFRVTETFGAHISRVRIRLATGRTHQIRVHMAHINHPLIGDQKYGKYNGMFKQIFSGKLNDYLCCFNRQALHACMLTLLHPITGKKMSWNISLPNDMSNLINILRKNKKVI